MFGRSKLESEIEELKTRCNKLEELLNLKDQVIKSNEIEIDRLTRLLFETKENKKLDYYSIEYLDKISELDFMKYIIELLTYLKYEKLKVCNTYENYELDIMASKEFITYLIKCKLSDNVLNEEYIDSVIKEKEKYNKHVAIVLTNSIFSTKTIKYAEKNNVILWDRKILENYIKSLKETKALEEQWLHNDDYDEDFYNEVVQYVTEIGKASSSILQRRFKIGYNKAARMIDILEEKGIISGPLGSKPREVLIRND